MNRSVPWRTARRMYALHQGACDWYRIRNQASGPAELYIYDEIGYFGVSAGELIRDLANVSGPLNVHINSPGGEVDDGIAIYNTLLARDGVTVFIDGVACSIASVIAMAGNPVKIARQGKMMIHDGHTLAIGNAQDLRVLAEHLDRTSDNIAQIYAEHTGKPVAYWRELMQAETWYYGEEAVSAGLADEVISGDTRSAMPRASDDWDLTIFNGPGHRPGREPERDAASVPWVGTRESRHEPMTGRHAHDHAAFDDDSHDDGMHYHEHEHRSDAHHDPEAPGSVHTHGPGMGHEAGAVPDATVRSDWVGQMMNLYHTQVLNWDAAAALSKCHSAADFRKVCAGEKSTGDPDSREHWALPHHSSPGAGADKGGVVAALGRWNQTQGLKNKEGALAHLKAHARELGLPSGDDDGKDMGDMPWIDLGDEEISEIITALKGA